MVTQRRTGDIGNCESYALHPGKRGLYKYVDAVIQNRQKIFFILS